MVPTLLIMMTMATKTTTRPTTDRAMTWCQSQEAKVCESHLEDTVVEGSPVLGQDRYLAEGDSTCGRSGGGQ